jgi:hypothetical protein
VFLPRSQVPSLPASPSTWLTGRGHLSYTYRTACLNQPARTPSHNTPWPLQEGHGVHFRGLGQCPGPPRCPGDSQSSPYSALASCSPRPGHQSFQHHLLCSRSQLCPSSFSLQSCPPPPIISRMMDCHPCIPRDSQAIKDHMLLVSATVASEADLASNLCLLLVAVALWAMVVPV